MVNSPLIQDHIRKGEVHSLKSRIAQSKELGMQTFDQALFEAYNEGVITQEDALAYADTPNDLRLMIKMENEKNGVNGNNSKSSFELDKNHEQKANKFT